MKKITLREKEFRLFIKSTDIDQAISRMAIQMNQELKEKKPLFLPVLNGSFMFASDLIKQITIPETEISFLKISSYSGTSSSGKVKELIGLNEEIKGRTLIILEDIIDSGKSMMHLLEYLQTKQPAEIKVATLFYKPKAILFPVPIHYLGIELENDFIVGRGLDYDGLGRNLPDLYILNS